LSPSGSGSGLPDLKNCPKCGFLVDAAKPVCPYCGTDLGPAPVSRKLPQPQAASPAGAPGTPVTVSRPGPDAPALSWTDRLGVKFRQIMFLFALYVLCPHISWWETTKKYFRIAFFFFVVVSLSYAFTGQWISGLIAGIIVLFLIYRSFMQMHETLESLHAVNPVPVLAVMAVMLATILTLLWLFPLPPMRISTGQELTRQLIMHGTLLLFGFAGYFVTKRPKK
jgi:hypothetical protein